MAKQKGHLLSGSIGPVINYSFRGQQVIRLKPARVKQTRATKESAKNFGRAVTISRHIRSAFTILGNFDKYPIMYGMNRVLIQWLKDSRDDPRLMERNIQLMKGFELNEEARLSRLLKLMPDVHLDDPKKLLFKMPELVSGEDILVPRSTTSIEMKIASFSCNTEAQRGGLTWYAKNTIEWDYTQPVIPEQQLEIPCEAEPNDILIVAIGLVYKQHSRIVDEKKWQPGGIVGVRYLRGEGSR